MRLSDRVRDGGELIQDFQQAAEERFLDAQELLARGHETGATYLVGYVAEILLKHAVFRFDGARPSDAVHPRLGQVRKWAKKALPWLDYTSGHNILFWAHVLREKRRRKGRPLARPDALNLMRIAKQIADAWAVELRYFGFEVDDVHAKRVFNDVAWIKSNQTVLWR